MIHFLRKYQKFWAIQVFVTLFCTWMVTYGSFNLFEKDTFGAFYDAQAESFIHGRLDIMRLPLVADEYFTRDGKNYIYFGPAPSFLHAPLMAFPFLRTKLSRLFMVFGVIITVMALSVLTAFAFGKPPDEMSRSELFWSRIFLLATTLGSSHLLLMSNSFVYHEALLLGSAFGLLGFLFLLKKHGTPVWILTGLIFFSLFSRQTFGLGLLATVGLIGLLTWKSDRHLAKKLIVLPFIFLGMIIALNWMKFRTFLNGIPCQQYIQFINDPQRMERVKGRFFHLNNFKTQFYNMYLNPNLEVRKQFPFIYLGNSVPVFPGSNIDINERSTGLLWTQPLLLIFFAVGLWFILKSERKKAMWPYLFGSCFGLVFVHFGIGVNERYKHEAFILLVLAGMFAPVYFSQAEKNLSRPLNFLLRMTVCLALLLQIFVNMAIALEYQGTVWTAAPKNRERFSKMQNWLSL